MERLPACTLTIHGLLHVAQDIRFCGPAWTTWTFFMERYCGFLQRSLRSQSQPWSSLENTVFRTICLEQLAVRYNLKEELTWWGDRRDDGPTGYEHVLETDCTSFLSSLHMIAHQINSPDPDHILRPPFKRPQAADPFVQKSVSHYIGQVIGKRVFDVQKQLPIPTFFAGKFRVRDGGDLFRTSASSHRPRTSVRRSCYVRVRPVTLL